MGNMCAGNVTYETANTDEPQGTPRGVTKKNTVKNNNKMDGIDETYLFNCWEAAIHVGDEDLVLKLLTNFSSKLINHEFSNGECALHVCAKKGYKKIIDYLLIFGDKLTKKSRKNGNTVLHYAVKKGNHELAVYLINRSFAARDMMEMENNRGKIPYEIAKKANDKVLMAAVKPNDSIRHPKTEQNETSNVNLGQVYLINSWEKAIYNGDVDAAWYLLYEHGSDLLNHEFSDGNYAIHICAKKGYYKLIWDLVHNGDDITRQNSKNGNTALHYAVLARNQEIVEFLFLKSQFKGCKINQIKNNDGKLAYDYALETNDEDLITFVTLVDKRKGKHKFAFGSPLVDSIWFSALGFND